MLCLPQQDPIITVITATTPNLEGDTSGNVRAEKWEQQNFVDLHMHCVDQSIKQAELLLSMKWAWTNIHADYNDTTQ